MPFAASREPLPWAVRRSVMASDQVKVSAMFSELFDS
jgi:hypothetical protein